MPVTPVKAPMGAPFGTNRQRKKALNQAQRARFKSLYCELKTDSREPFF